MARHNNPRFYIGPKTNELVLGIGRAFSTLVSDPLGDVSVTFTRRMCGASDEITFISYAVTPDGFAHFEIPDNFRTDADTWGRGFYDGVVNVGDCYIGDVELIKAPGHYLSFGQSVQDRCKGGTVWVEPSCDELMIDCNCNCKGNPTSYCNCKRKAMVGDNCPTCYNEEFVTRAEISPGWIEPVSSILQATDLVTVVEYVGNSPVNEGEDLKWTVTVTNNGPTVATSVTATVLLPQGLVPTMINGQAGQGTYSTSSGIWNIGNIPVGTSVVLGLEGTAQPTTGGLVITLVSSAATSGTPDNNATPDTLSAGQLVNSLVDLVTMKSVERNGVSSLAANVPAGGTFTWVIDVENRGFGTAPSVSLTDLIDHPLFANVTYSTSAGAFNNVTNEWVIGNLGPGATAKLEAEVTLSTNVPIGFAITNRTSRALSPGQADTSVAGDQLEATITIV